jgi:putative ABC transport system permease protein
MILARLVRRPGRPAEFFLAALVATTGVTVLPRLSAVEVAAVDRTSDVLLVAMLVVCSLFLANSAATAVRERGRELAVLACLGWPGRSLAALFLGEVCLVGFLAGAVGVGLAYPLGRALGVEGSRPWLAIPVALVLCLVAAAVPALRVTRAQPVGLTNRRAGVNRRRARRHRHVISLAATNLGRSLGRTVLGAACLAGGIGGLTLVIATVPAFRGTVAATLLVDPVSVRVRSVDLAAALATVTIGAVAVADVLYVSARDRAAELATLRVAGWSDAALARLVAYEGLGIGIIGVAAGVPAGLWGAAQFTGASGLVALTAVASVATGLVVVGLAAAGPALRQRRAPVSGLLAEE